MEVTKPIPEQLHRYFSFDRGMEMLGSKKLYFANLSSYNDIFESVPATDFVEAATVTPERAAQVLKEMQETKEGKYLISLIEESFPSSEIVLSTALASMMTSSVGMPILGLALAGIYALPVG